MEYLEYLKNANARDTEKNATAYDIYKKLTELYDDTTAFIYSLKFIDNSLTPDEIEKNNCLNDIINTSKKSLRKFMKKREKLANDLYNIDIAISNVQTTINNAQSELIKL